jgi:hypothetical protein
MPATHGAPVTFHSVLYSTRGSQTVTTLGLGRNVAFKAFASIQNSGGTGARSGFRCGGRALAAATKQQDQVIRA